MKKKWEFHRETVQIKSKAVWQTGMLQASLDKWLVGFDIRHKTDSQTQDYLYVYFSLHLSSHLHLYLSDTGVADVGTWDC